ncbi:hypothetical protein DL768_005629 [Monosporascus sp. mg162]|nr:hypothetical protein DL768_005629 [Monosporascus sp. mg162]
MRMLRFLSPVLRSNNATHNCRYEKITRVAYEDLGRWPSEGDRLRCQLFLDIIKKVILELPTVGDIMSFAAVNRAARAVVLVCIASDPSGNVISALMHGMRSLRGKRVPKKTKATKPAKEARESKGFSRNCTIIWTIRENGKEGVTAGKHKLAELLGDKGDEGESSAKKRKIKHPAKPILPKKIATCYGAIRTKITAATLKGTMSNMPATTKSALTAKSANPSTKTLTGISFCYTRLV